ncbi:hypothetical protein ADUPG1_011764 [Aduncisulcus paluster]|uniref:Uncharacterized protein n=1 Tax=Aduncisulcus paluster TaxID=2918883 RepID=A0ABQ5K1W9_9EUKA|nr:hypothetical protein ADUPG1_011764 [Aduncisulcus paluster]
MIGNVFGPKHQSISFVSGSSTFTYPFNTNKYVWGQPWMTNSVILGGFLGILFLIILTIVVIACIMNKRKLRKYKELRKLDEEEAIKASLLEAERGGSDQVFDMSFLYTEVPWESEEEEDSDNTDDGESNSQKASDLY